MITLNALTKEQQTQIFVLTTSAFIHTVACHTSNNFEQAVARYKPTFNAYRRTIDSIVDGNVTKLVESSLVGMLSVLHYMQIELNERPDADKNDHIVGTQKWFLQQIADVSKIEQTALELKLFGKSQFMFVDLNKEQMKEAQELMDQHKPALCAMFEDILNAPTALGIPV